MGRFGRSVQLIKASWFVLRSSKGLLVFPVLSAVASLLVAASFLTPAFVASWDSVRESDSLRPATYVFLALFYLVTAYVTIFFNAALISQANVALSGGRPSVAAGLKVAGANWLRILPWALLSATVSIILRAIEERLGFVGRIVAAIVGVAWNLVTFFVLPVLVLERVGVGAAMTRSKEMLRRTWGENVLGNAGLGLLALVALLPTFALVALGVYAGHATLLVCLGLTLVWFLVVGLVSAAMSGIYQTALYRYAAIDRATMLGDFPLSEAFRPRKR